MFYFLGTEKFYSAIGASKHARIELVKCAIQERKVQHPSNTPTLRCCLLYGCLALPYLVPPTDEPGPRACLTEQVH